MYFRELFLARQMQNKAGNREGKVKAFAIISYKSYGQKICMSIKQTNNEIMFLGNANPAITMNYACWLIIVI